MTSSHLKRIGLSLSPFPVAVAKADDRYAGKLCERRRQGERYKWAPVLGTFTEKASDLVFASSPRISGHFNCPHE